MPTTEIKGTLTERQGLDVPTLKLETPATPVASMAFPPIPDADAQGAVLTTVPVPLNGQEVAGIIIFRIAEQLAKAFENNYKFSEGASYPDVIIDVKASIGITNAKLGNEHRNKVAQLDLPLIHINVVEHPNLVDMLRLESGMGLWHRQVNAVSGFNFTLMKPVRRVVEHILRMATELELGRKSGITGGTNK